MTRCRPRARRSTRPATSDAPSGALSSIRTYVRRSLSALPEEELERELREQAAHVDAGLCRLVELAAECEERLDWSSDRTTFAAWLAWRCSLAPRQAREHARLGERLRGLPLLAAAFGRGELSYAKASVLVTVAEPSTEAELLELAAALSASQLARCVGAYRRVSAEEAAERQERQFLDCFWSEEGWLVLRGRLTAEEGAVFAQALEAARDVLWQRQRAGQTDAPPEATERTVPYADGGRASNVEALSALAELALAGRERERPGGERCQLVVHVDRDTLTTADGRCELDDGQTVALETARRLGCDASLVEVVEVVEDGGRVLSLGRKRRTVSAPLRRALTLRDRGCRFPGCERTRFVDAHHVRHWSRGGETDLDNLVLLCRRHHRLVHEHGYTMSLDDDGSTRFRNRHGIAIPNAPPRPPPSSPDALPGRHRRRKLLIDHDTCQNGTGDRMDLPLAVDALIDIVG